MQPGPSFRQKNSGIIPWRRLPLLLAALLLLTSAGCQQLTGRKSEVASPSGAQLFQAKCGSCHDLEKAMGKYRTEGLWYVTINRMKEEHQADISREEVEQLVQYHVARQRQEAEIFQEKCQKCHPGQAFLAQRLSGEQARALIKRMQQKAGNTIEDQDIEVIVRYHAQAQQTALENNLQGIYRQILVDQPGMQKGLALFLEKCSSCHQPGRALAMLKDSGTWAQTIKRMQSYSKGAISDREAKELVDFHVSEQQKEIRTFAETCTKCHSDERINSRSMSEEQWLTTIKRMQEKAPELISDEKVNLLAAYFHRRELTLARIFADKCHLCHQKGQPAAALADASVQLNGLITMANAEYGGVLAVKDVNSLLATHVERQKRSMQLYAKNCTACHPDGPPKKRGPDEPGPRTPSRAEWISFIAALQEVELTKESQTTINSQIDFHLSRF